jgi:hypothetical protein
MPFAADGQDEFPASGVNHNPTIPSVVLVMYGPAAG